MQASTALVLIERTSSVGFELVKFQDGLCVHFFLFHNSGNLKAVNVGSATNIAAIFNSIPILEGNYILEHSRPNNSQMQLWYYCRCNYTFLQVNPALGDTQRVMGFNSR